MVSHRRCSITAGTDALQQPSVPTCCWARGGKRGLTQPQKNVRHVLNTQSTLQYTRWTIGSPSPLHPQACCAIHRGHEAATAICTAAFARNGLACDPSIEASIRGVAIRL